QSVDGVERGDAGLLDFAVDVFAFAAGLVKRHLLHEEIFGALLDNAADTGEIAGEVRKHVRGLLYPERGGNAPHRSRSRANIARFMFTPRVPAPKRLTNSHPSFLELTPSPR